MNKQQITENLTAKHLSFTEFTSALSEDEFLFANQGKWSAGQQLDHIIRAVAPVKMALTLPGFIPKLIFGKAKRTSISYEELVSNYQAKLASGSKAGGKFIPSAVRFDQRNTLTRRLTKLVEQLSRRIEKIPDEQLDQLMLPHPILGKLTAREMLYFTIYHVEHHQVRSRENLR